MRPLFKLKVQLDEHLEELSRVISLENGKASAESMAELRRAIENVEVVCGMRRSPEADRSRSGFRRQ
jgi:malonate-semialdehyde dehydrogenase (acetylating) / methylmalonate-semialdehyde dehydrogenase